MFEADKTNNGRSKNVPGKRDLRQYQLNYDGEGRRTLRLRYVRPAATRRRAHARLETRQTDRQAGGRDDVGAAHGVHLIGNRSAGLRTGRGGREGGTTTT